MYHIFICFIIETFQTNCFYYVIVPFYAHKLASTPIMEASPKNVTVLDGKDATIVCRAVGAPQPNVTYHYGTGYNGKFSSH